MIGEVAEVFAAEESEGRGFDGRDGGENAGDHLVETADQAKHQQAGGGLGEHAPFTAAGIDEGAGLEGGRRCSWVRRS